MTYLLLNNKWAFAFLCDSYIFLEGTIHILETKTTYHTVAGDYIMTISIFDFIKLLNSMVHIITCTLLIIKKLVNK